MKKILLGLLALSAVSFAVQTTSVPVQVTATIGNVVPGDYSLVLYAEETGNATKNGFEIDHTITNKNDNTNLVVSDIIHVAVVNNSNGIALPIGSGEGKASFDGFKLATSTLTLTGRSGSINTVLTSDNKENAFGSRKPHKVTSTLTEETIINAKEGYYVGTTNVTITYNVPGLENSETTR